MEETRESVIMDETGQREGLKKDRKHFSKIGWMYVVGTIVIYIVQLVPMALVQFLQPKWAEDPNAALLVSMLPMYLIGMPVLILLLKRIPAEVPERHKMKQGQFVVSAIMCFAIVYLSNIVGTILTTIIGVFKGSEVQNQILNVTADLNLWTIFFIMVICAPCIEEFVFRKLLVDRTVRYGQGVAIVISGLMFGLFHGNLNQFMYAFVLGMFLAYLYVKTGNLKITIALHMLVNFFGGVVSSLLLKLINLDEYYDVVSQGMDMDVMMNYFMEHLAGWVVYLIYVVFVLGVTITGTVLLIVNLVKKKFFLSRGEIVIPKGKRFSTVILNAGMIVYCIIWIATIIAQLFV